MRRVGALLLLALSGARAQDTSWPVDRVGVQMEHFHLGRGQSNWDDVAIHLSRRWSPRDGVEAGIARTYRFGADDTELRIHGSRALAADLTGTLQASASPTHRVLPRGSVGGALAYEVAPAWLLHGGLRHITYDATGVTQGRFGAERYLGGFSVLGTWSPAQALGRRTASYETRVSWFGNNGASVALLLATGDEATLVGTGQVAVADVRTVALFGRQPMDKRLWLTWSASRTGQGGFHTRAGGAIGVESAF